MPTPKVVVSASCGIEVSRVVRVQADPGPAIDLARRKPEHCVILQRPQAPAALTAGRDLDWIQAAAEAEPADCVPVAATDPLYILYTSGTTAKPKGVVRDNGGHAVALRWSMEQHLRHRARRGVLGRLRRGVGRRALLHRLRPAAGRVHDRAVRGEAGGHAGRGRVLAGDRRAPGQGAVHRADRVPGDQEGGPGRQAGPRVRPVRAAVPVPGRRAARPGDLPVGGRAARHPGHRPLVADRDRLADRRRPDGPGGPADQGRVAHHAGARLRRADRRRRRCRGRAGRDRRDRGAAAAAAGMPAHLVARRRAVRRLLPVAASPVSTSPATAGTATATATCT